MHTYALAVIHFRELVRQAQTRGELAGSRPSWHKARIAPTVDLR
jgi:hypothetical protein